ncbi:uncharacterized protein ATNIH1004_009697 [Aspergillus tanneri]|uniref:Uncharacterized protein n=1 Tax=Aspergillus tanneri TaxID=1220188 RepID=A0A5M9MB87_9EURO|nr:uncharacterized protein ATNIH1004_009697 [Aspergillus tanneri]KAA8642936.1 hypothetical protein ATNIH1004_009697 [Aspergillus tanneri]
MVLYTLVRRTGLIQLTTKDQLQQPQELLQRVKGALRSAQSRLSALKPFARPASPDYHGISLSGVSSCLTDVDYLRPHPANATGYRLVVTNPHPYRVCESDESLVLGTDAESSTESPTSYNQPVESRPAFWLAEKTMGDLSMFSEADRALLEQIMGRLSNCSQIDQGLLELLERTGRAAQDSRLGRNHATSRF